MPTLRPVAFLLALLSATTFASAESRDILVSGHFLYLPITSRARPRNVTLSTDGNTFLFVPVEVADGAPEWWSSVDVSSLKGKTLHVQANDLAANSSFLANIDQGDAPVKGAADLYKERLRPLAHFSATRGWINDPNGLLFYAGTYHMFFQLDPAGWNGNTKYWGHATSTDLVHWTERAPAIAPDDRGDIWSGSGVVDVNNTSGQGDGKTPPLAFFYTAARMPFSQFAVFSTDAGLTFTKFAGNPVVPNLHADNRDPRVLWHEATKQWVMVVWVPVPTDGSNHRDAIQFLTSTNLRDWTPTSQTDGYFECPDLIAFPNDRWVLTSASGVYQVGTFDGKTFAPKTPHLQSVGHGTFYAAQTFSNIPKSDGRVLQVGWMRAESPGMPFNQCLSTVQELKLLDTPDGPRLSRAPIRELEILRSQPITLAEQPLPPGERFLGDATSEALDIELDLTLTAGKLDLNLRGVPITWNADTQELFVNGRKSPTPFPPSRQQLRILLDRTTVELFANNGLTYIPVNAIPPTEKHDLRLAISGPGGTLHAMNIYPLKSMWATPAR
jgi:sucrose-6-phosphate hydrolase SacC (GH32 family)